MSDNPSNPAGPEAPVMPEAPPLPWADVQPEHFKMLRLAPLQTDRSTGARPLRFVQFGYAERNNTDHSLLRTVDTHIKTLRQKLKSADAQETIVTHRGLGYELRH